MSTYFTNFINGLQHFVLAELQQKIDGIKIIDRDKERIIFRYSGDARHLLKLRSVEDLYFCLRHLKGVNRSRNQLGRIDAAARKADLKQAIKISQKLGLRWRGRLCVRVHAEMTGHHNFRRVDTQYAVEHGLLSRSDQICRVDRNHPHAEICVVTQNNETHLLWRLTDKSFRQHGKRVHLPASLRPTVAYAMVQESQPRSDEIFLDPMCGTGTILLERANSGRYRYLLGGDLDWQAIRAASTNIGPRHQPRRLFWWDALKLSLKDHSVDKIVCNLPFGKQLSITQPNFYSDFLREAERVLHPKGRMVLLVSDKNMCRVQARYRLLNAAKKTGWKIRKVTSIVLLGQRSFLCTFACLAD